MNARILTLSLTLSTTLICSAQTTSTTVTTQTTAPATTNTDDAIRANLIQPDKSGETIALENTPAIVQQRIRRQAAFMPLKSITRSMQGNQPVYNATFVGQNVRTEMQLAENGTALGMRILSAAPVVYQQNPAPRTARAAAPATATQAEVAAQQQHQQPTIPTGVPTATETTVPQQTVVQTTGPIPSVPNTDNATEMPTAENPPIQFEAAGAQPSASTLPSQIQSMVQQQLGSAQIESSRPITIYQINARDVNGQPQTYWVDETGRLIK